MRERAKSAPFDHRKSAATGSGSGSSSGEEEEEEEDARHSLIMHLSQQLEALGEELEEANEEIARLKGGEPAGAGPPAGLDEASEQDETLV